MVNEILMRGATPIAMPQPVEGAQPIVSDAPPAGDDFAKVLLAEMDGPAPAAMKGAGGAPAVAAPPAITLETIPVVPPPMIAPPARSAPPALAPEGGAGGYTVQQGDSLSKIARKLGQSNWRALYAANRTTIGANPNMIHPGQVLSLPANWQAAAADTSRVAHASRTVVEPVAKLPANPVAPVDAPVDPNTAGTVSAPEAKAPTLTSPVVPIEASQEPMPVAPAAPVAGPVSAAPADPTPADIASEAIDRLTAEANGSPDHVATLREALRSIPQGSASYDAYRAKVEAYESAVGAAPAGAAPMAAAPPVPMAPPVAPNVPMTPLDQAPPASDPVGGGGFAPPAPGFAPPAPAGFVPPAPADAYGPSGPAGAEAGIIHAEAAPPAPAAMAPAPDVPAAPAEGAAADGEEDWQAFS